jgi:type II secretion system (T2SS) protein E
MSSRSRVGDFLLRANVIDDLQLRSARATHAQWGGRLGKVIADMGLADEDQITDAIAQAMKLPREQIGSARDPGALAKLDPAFCEQHAVFPVRLDNNGKSLVLAMADPSDLEVMDMASGRARSRVKAVVASETEIKAAIARCYHGADAQGARPSRARQAVQLAEESAETDVKITDMSGNTVMKVNPALSAAEAAAATNPSASGAGSILDELLTGRSAQPSAPALTPEEQQRLAELRTNQERSGKALRAVMELLQEKGYATSKEVLARRK